MEQVKRFGLHATDLPACGGKLSDASRKRISAHPQKMHAAVLEPAKGWLQYVDDQLDHALPVGRVRADGARKIATGMWDAQEDFGRDGACEKEGEWLGRGMRPDA